MKHGYKLIILDNDSKFHTKALVEAAEGEGLQIYPGSGKKYWVPQCFHLTFNFTSKDRSNGPGVDVIGKYPARSHEDMPPETEFANSFEDAQLNVERREKNSRKRRTMLMWRNAVEHT